MRYTKVLLLIIFSLSFSNPLKGLYVSYDVSAEGTAVAETEILGVTVEVEDDQDLTGGLTIGYDYSIAGAAQVGVSYDILNMEPDVSGFDGDGTGFLSVYGKYSYATGAGNAWGSLGYNIPLGDPDDFDGGLMAGLGYTSPFGVGGSVVVHSMSDSDTYEGIESTVSATVTRISVYYQF